MKKPLLLLLLASLPASAQAQLDYYARLGLTGSSALVRDVLFQPYETKQGISPTLVAGFSIPVGTDNRLGIEGQLTSGPLRAETSGEGGSSDADLGRLTTFSALANAEGTVSGPVRWRIGIGLIKYLPSEEAGLFAQGGPLRYFVGGGLDFRRPAFPGWDLMVSARYDFHRFTTEELRDRGFTQAQGVQRGSLTAGLARSLGIAR
ncbi:MAG TPA: hypothetical protein VF037_07275 [Gemmatimonadales bacterium]